MKESEKISYLMMLSALDYCFCSYCHHCVHKGNYCSKSGHKLIPLSLLEALKVIDEEKNE